MNTIVAQRQRPPSLLFAAAKPLVWRVPGLPLSLPCSTPYVLGACAAAILACSVLFLLASTHTIREGRNTIKSVGLDCAPSIVAALGIRTDLADLDANLVNEFLCAPLSKEGKDAEKAADERHRQVSEQLVIAAKNITFGENEQVPITTMVSGLGTYESMMATARALQQKGDNAAMFTAARQASRLLHDVIIPAADALDQANSTVLEKTYADHRQTSQGAIAGLIFSGILLVAALALAQIYLTRKTHRLLNVGLLAATGISLFLLVTTTSQALRSSDKLRAAVDDAFASVHFLWQARAIGFDANGEESRYLFDPENAGLHQRAFFQKADSVAKPPSGESLEDMATTGAASATLPATFTGSLARELGNITFPGEREAAAETVRTFGVYLDVDKKIRSLETSGRHSEAIALCISEAPGGSNAAFEAFDAALNDTLKINQIEFDRSVEAGFKILAGAEWTIGISILLVAASTVAGFWPRLKEY